MHRSMLVLPYSRWPQCLLHAANFVEFFQLHLDSTGKLMSLEFLFAEGVQCQVGAVASPSTRFVGKATVTTTQLVASYVHGFLWLLPCYVWCGWVGGCGRGCGCG